MRGFMSSLIGVAALILLLRLYTAWVDASQIDRSLSAYVSAVSDVYKRAELEDRLFDVLKRDAMLCKGLMDQEGFNPGTCQAMVNADAVRVLASYGVESPCPSPFFVAVLPDRIRVVAACEISGRIGSALFRVPRGAEVSA